MQYLTMIIVSQQEGHAGLNIARRAVRIGNHNGLTNGMIAVERQKRLSSILIVGIDGIGTEQLINNGDM
jgi:hypothetical protein